MPLLDVKNLSVCFDTTHDGVVRVVDNLSYSLVKGEVLGIIGESGSGKSQSILSIVGLLAKNGIAKGGALFHGKDLLSATEAELNDIRGDKIALIFQNPMTSLNPYLRISTQMTEVLIRHRGMSSASALKQSIELLDAVRIPEAGSRIKRYPHELSGGMRQRVLIAIAMLCEPDLIIADEPTTALDVTIQAQIITMLLDLRRQTGVSIIFVTHDFGVIAEVCDNVLVMYGGQMMEYGTVDQIFEDPYHPYTKALLKSIPPIDHSKADQLHTIPGNPPDITQLPIGCPFSPRCESTTDFCVTQRLIETKLSEQRRVACHRHPVAPQELA